MRQLANEPQDMGFFRGFYTTYGRDLLKQCLALVFLCGLYPSLGYSTVVVVQIYASETPAQLPTCHARAT